MPLGEIVIRQLTSADVPKVRELHVGFYFLYNYSLFLTHPSP
jgi:hypothetical protein